MNENKKKKFKERKRDEFWTTKDFASNTCLHMYNTTQKEFSNREVEDGKSILVREIY